jgi:hypothetical protein
MKNILLFVTLSCLVIKPLYGQEINTGLSLNIQEDVLKDKPIIEINEKTTIINYSQVSTTIRIKTLNKNYLVTRSKTVHNDGTETITTSKFDSLEQRVVSRLSEKQTARGSITTKTFYEYDANNRLIKILYKNLNGELTNFAIYAYNEFDHPVSLELYNNGRFTASEELSYNYETKKVLKTVKNGAGKIVLTSSLPIQAIIKQADDIQQSMILTHEKTEIDEFGNWTTLVAYRPEKKGKKVKFIEINRTIKYGD